MAIVEYLIGGLVLLIIILNFIAEPALSVQYFKTTVKSVGIIIVKIKDFAMSFKKEGETNVEQET